MADFTALKTAIQNAIKQNGNEEITGNLLQEVLLAIVTTLGDGRINELITALGTEATTRSQADGTLQQNINTEANARSQADTALGGRIDGVVSSIEAINDAIENGYVYAGIATPSSTPASGKVFYLALTAGTYTNFDNIAVTQGINILKYNGSAWSLDAFVGIDDTPTPSSQKLIKSGGVFDEVMKNGSAFDLSAYNGGATYADLSAALTALNILPAAYKKGGMSMKFVQTSDNNYIQARLMSNSFTTDVTEWQIIDKEPTENSKNLVTSGGVKKATDKIEVEQYKQESTYNRQNSEGFIVSDDKGNVALKVNEDGLDTYNYRNEQEGFYVTDKNGNVAFKIDENGNVDYNGKTNNNTQLKDDGNIPADIVYNILYGQSLSLGGFVEQGENMSTTLEFNTGDGFFLDGLTSEIINDPVALNEYFDGFLNAETGINCTGIGFANTTFMRLLNKENGIDIGFDNNVPKYMFQLIGCNPTFTGGGSPWQTLADTNGLYYKRIIASVEYGKKIAEKEGKTFKVGSFCYMQGESSYDAQDTKKKFYDKLWVLFSNINYDIKQITGQEEDVICMTYQLASQAVNTSANNSLGVPLAQLQIALDEGDGTGYTLDSGVATFLKNGAELMDRKNIHLSCVMNALDYYSNSDKIHCSNNSYMANGVQMGIQAKRSIYDNKPIVPIHIQSKKVFQTENGYMLILGMYANIYPLVIDTDHEEMESQRATSSNYGFSILSNGIEIIESVSLRRGKEVAILCSQNPTGLTLTYAKDGWEIGGNLRDSQEIEMTFNNILYKAHNWCPTFEEVI